MELISDSVYRKMLFLKLLTSMSLILPVRVVWLLLYGMNAGDISFFKVAFSLTVSFFEIPTGIVADLLSRRLSMALGTVFFALHAVFYVLWPGFATFLITQVLLGLSASFMSGADTAYLHTYVNGRTSEKAAYADISGKLSLAGKIASAVYSVASALIYSYSPRLVFLASFVMGMGALFIVLALPEDAMERVPLRNIRVRHFFDKPKAAMKVILGSRAMVTLTLATALVFSFLIFNFEMYQVKFNIMGLPVKYNGIIYAGFMILMGFGGNSAKHFVKRMSSMSAILLLTLFISASFFIFGFSNSLTLLAVAILLQQVSFGCWEIIVDNFILENCPEQQIKSTLSSMNSLFISLFKGAAIAAMGIFASLYSLKAVYIGMGILTPGLVLLLSYKPRTKMAYE